MPPDGTAFVVEPWFAIDYMLMTRLQTLLLIVATCTALAAGPAQSPTFRLWSDDISGTVPQAHVYDGFGCTGDNVSPHLAWSGAPKGTRSFVLTVFDPDAPTGSGFWHWAVANIPATSTTIARNASRTPRMPAGSIETRTDFGDAGYHGPCPPAGGQPHRYIFTLHALTVDRIDVDTGTSGALVGLLTNANRLASASFTATYGR
jgi:Raf kinase inhibitor-like YbhB/YbcL family protein